MTYLACYSPHKDDVAAIDLACQFARSEQDSVHALTLVPRGWETAVAGDTDRDFEQWAAEEGAASAAEALEVLARHTDIESTATWVTGRSVPQAVCDQAAALEASLIVVGSGENGPRGYVTVTSKTDRMLHSAAVPVAIAPRGYRPAPNSRVTRVTMDFRDDDASWTLRDLVAGICARVGASLRLVTFAVRPRRMVVSAMRNDEADIFAQWRAQARAGLDDALAHLREQGLADVDAVLAEGRSWSGAMDGVDWGREEVLVVGSSSTHRLA